MSLKKLLFGGTTPTAATQMAKPAGVPDVLHIDVSEWRGADGEVAILSQLEGLVELTLTELRAEYMRLLRLAYGQNGVIANHVAYARMTQVALIRDVRATYGNAVELQIVTPESSAAPAITDNDEHATAVTPAVRCESAPVPSGQRRIADQRRLRLPAPRERPLNTADAY